MVGRRPLVSSVHYSLCLYHLLILLGSKIIPLTIQQGQCLSIWNMVEFRNFCCLEWKDLEQLLSLNRYVCCFFFLPSVSLLLVFVHLMWLVWDTLAFLFLLNKGLNEEL